MDSFKQTQNYDPCFSEWTKYTEERLIKMMDLSTTERVCCGNKITDMVSFMRHQSTSHGKRTFLDMKLTADHKDLCDLSRFSHFQCPCGMKMTTFARLMNHLESAHRAGFSFEKAIVLRMPNAQGNLELVKTLRRNAIQTRIALLQHVEGILEFNVEEWVRPSTQGATIFINLSDKNLIYQQLTTSENSLFVCYSEDNENDYVLRILRQIVWSKLPKAQSIDISVLGFKFGQISMDPGPALDALFAAGGIISFLRGFWLATTEVKGWLLLGCASSMFSSDKLRSAFLKQAETLTNLMTEPVAHAGADEALKAIFVLFGLVIFKIIPKQGNIDAFVKSVSTMGSFSLGMIRSLDGVTRLLEWLRTAGFKSLFGFALEDDEISETREIYENIRSELTDLVSNEQLHDATYCRRVKALHTKFAHLYSSSDMYALPGDFRQTLTFLNQKISKLMDRVTAAGTLGAGTRIEPVVLSFKGPAGIGKSHVAFAFIAKAIKKLVPECKDWQEELYVRNQSQEFWDSYHGQSVTMYDDFGQLVDTVAKPNPEFIELIKSQNIVRYPLHMASIDDKSNTFFCSRLIVLTSNLGEFTTKSLSSNEALRRRIEMDIELRPKRLVNGKAVIDNHPDPRDYDYVFKDGHVASAEEVLQELFKRLDIKANRSAEFTAMMNNISSSPDFADFGTHEDIRINTSIPPPSLYSVPPPPIPPPQFAGVGPDDLMDLDVDQLETMVSTLERDIPTGQGALSNFVKFMIPIAHTDSLFVRWADANGYILNGKEYPIHDRTTPIPPGATPCIIGYRSFGAWLRTLSRLAAVYKIVTTFVPLLTRLFRSKSTEKKQSAVVDSHHNGLPIGKRVKHRHVCVVCSQEFSHEHVIVHPTEQREKGFDVCTNCKTLIGKKESVVREIVGGKIRPFTGQSEEFLKDANRLIDQGVEEVSIERRENRYGYSYAAPGYFTNMRGKPVPTDETSETEAYDDGRTPKPAPRKVEAYDDGRTPKPATRKIEAYDDGRTPKPAPRVVERYDDGRTPKPPVTNVQCEIRRPHQVAMKMMEKQMVSNQRYTEMDEVTKTAYDEELTTAHVERTRLHRRLVYDAAEKYRLQMPDLDFHQIQSHDMSKFDEVELIGYTAKWHLNEDNKPFFFWIAERYNTTLDDTISRLWEIALNHHYEHNTHHPQQHEMTATTLQEAICDMIAVSCEKKGIPIPEWEEVAELIFENDGAYVARFKEDEILYLRTLTRNETISLEGIVDHNARLLTLSLDKNQYSLFAGFSNDQNDLTRVQNVVFLRGKVALVNAHSLALMKDATWVRIINPVGRTYTFPARECVLKAFNTKRCDDVGIIIFPRQCPDHPDITHHFIKGDQVGRFTTVSATLLTHQFIPPAMVSAVRHVVQARLETDRSYLTTDDSGTHAKTLAQCYTYGAVTVPGDCGSLLVATSTSVPNKILGFHCWGYADGRGGAFVITQEEMAMILDRLPARAQTAMPIFGKFDGPVLDGTNYLGLGMVPAAPVATKTKLERTKLDYIAPKTAPAQLRPNREHDPLRKAMVKYSCATPAIEPTMLAHAVNDVKKVLFAGDMRSQYSQLGALSTQEAIAGVPEMPFMDSLNRTTSPGYPYVLTPRSKRGKQDWISDDMVPVPELVEDINKRISMMKEGKRCPAIWMDNLKDERRPIEKVAAGKTRVFTGGPMDFTIVFRSFFLAFSAFLMHNRISNEIAVGVNPFEEWGPLARKLIKHGDYMVAGDFSLYDSSLHAQILWSILDIVNDFHADGHEQMRYFLWLEIVNSIHLCKGQVYSIDHGNPSGNPITSIVNSLFNMIIVRLVYMHTTGLPVETFTRNVSFITYGDDNVIGIAPEIHGVFNQETITAGFKHFGMVYTREDKTTTEGGFRSIKEVNFLKRSFINRGQGYWAAPLAIDTVLEIPLWIKTQVDIEENVIDNCETCFRELSLHGEEMYNHWTQRISDNFRLNYDACLAVLPYEAQYETVTKQKLGMGRIGMTVIESQQSLNLSGQFVY